MSGHRWQGCRDGFLLVHLVGDLCWSLSPLKGLCAKERGVAIHGSAKKTIMYSVTITYSAKLGCQQRRSVVRETARVTSAVANAPHVGMRGASYVPASQCSSLFIAAYATTAWVVKSALSNLMKKQERRSKTVVAVM